jgi:hypothetical protein
MAGHGSWKSVKQKSVNLSTVRPAMLADEGGFCLEVE